MHDVLQRLYQYILLMRLNRPIGILLLLWPTLWALWIAGRGQPHAYLVVIFISGVFLTRSAGCIINDFIDQHFDAHVARTKQRPLVTKKITRVEALILFIILCSLAFILILQLNIFAILLAIPALALMILYPFCKRWIPWPQAVLGLAFSWSIPMVFAAETKTVPAIAWLLFLTASIWPLIYDTFYAMTDRNDDIKIGINSTAIWFGAYDRLITAALQFFMLSLLLLLGQLLKLNHWYFYSLIIVTLLFAYQQYLIKDRIPTQTFHAFLHNHWSGLTIFIGILLGYLPN